MNKFLTKNTNEFYLLRPKWTPSDPPTTLHSEKNARTSSGVADQGRPLAFTIILSDMIAKNEKINVTEHCCKLLAFDEVDLFFTPSFVLNNVAFVKCINIVMSWAAACQ